MGIERIGVPGEATMGAGIARVCAPEPLGRRRHSRGPRCLILLLTLLVAGPLPGSAQDAPEGAVQEELVSLRARMATLEGELARLASERESVVNSFETADVELALRRQQLSVLEQRDGVLARERAERETELERLEADFVELRAALRARVGSLYRAGPLSYNRLLLAADSASDALIAYQIMTYLAARDRDLLQSVRITVAEVDQTRAALAETERQLATVARRYRGHSDRPGAAAGGAASAAYGYRSRGRDPARCADCGAALRKPARVHHAGSFAGRRRQRSRGVRQRSRPARVASQRRRRR